MTNKGVLLAVSLLSLVCSGCSAVRPSYLPNHAEAYKVIPVVAPGFVRGAIQPGDRLSIHVLGEPDLTSEQYFVDDNGQLEMPLAGEMKVVGLAPDVVRAEIVRRLGSRYVRDPQVSVSVAEHARESITVEGEVMHAGRFGATPGLTLLGAIALAGSPSPAAKTDEIYILRTVDGQHMGARFNVNNIRNGRDPDPQIISGDTVVVGHSDSKAAWVAFLQTIPLLNLYYIFK